MAQLPDKLHGVWFISFEAIDSIKKAQGVFEPPVNSLRDLLAQFAGMRNFVPEDELNAQLDELNNMKKAMPPIKVTADTIIANGKVSENLTSVDGTDGAWTTFSTVDDKGAKFKYRCDGESLIMIEGAPMEIALARTDFDMYEVFNSITNDESAAAFNDGLRHAMDNSD